MSVLTTGKFWAATAERAVKTAAQSVIGSIGATAVVLSDVNWEIVAGAAGLATVLSVVTSIASAGAGATGPSLGPEELTPKA